MKRVPVWSSQKQGRGHIIRYLKCDDRDYPILVAIKWRENSRGYPRFSIKSSAKTKTVNLKPEGVVWAKRMGVVPEGFEIDHVNRNRYDTMLENLRLATRQQQTQNRCKSSHNTTGYKGVYIAYGHFRASATLDGKIYYNGTRHKTAGAANRAAIALRKRLGFLGAELTT